MRKINMKRRLNILNFIDSYTKEYGIPPSVREIGASEGLCASTTHAYLSSMKREGLVDWSMYDRRTIKVKGDG